MPHQSFYNFWHLATNQSGGSFEQHWLPESYNRLAHHLKKDCQIVYIPTLRRIPSKLIDYKDEYGGGGDEQIIEKLAVWANPTHTQASERQKFDSIQRFIRKVLKREDISLSIPHNKETINVEEYGRYLPIEALGTGIHQLVLLAANALLHENSVVCIEEPELHFHPELQHQFMHFINEQTTNQYFIATHSAHIMDAVPCSIYSIQLRDGNSYIDQPLTAQERHRACHALGYRPSSLLQANSLLWVEGPSDRMYILHWLKAVAPELEEGWHFSVMHYGGRLLSHLSATDEHLADFISLLPINRFPAILIDSDKRCAQDEINATKSRIIEEVESCNGIAWVTGGREIENYVPRQIRLDALRAVVSSDASLKDKDDVFGPPLSYRGQKQNQKIDKVAVARAVCNSPADLNVLDLKESVYQLANFILRANHMSELHLPE